MNEAVIQTLQSVPRMLHNPFVFMTTTVESVSGTESRTWAGRSMSAKIDNFHWHRLSHSFPSRLVKKGTNLCVVSELVGHHSLDMTERGAHLAPDFLQSAVDMLAIHGTQVTPVAQASNSPSLGHSFQTMRP